FCRRIKDIGFLVKLDTNGSNPDVIKHLLDENLVDYIAMDIKHRLDRYIETSVNKTDPSVYARSIQLIMDRSPDYEFRTTVIRGIHSADDIAVMAQMIEGARRYFLQNYRAGHTIDPNYPGASFTTAELKELKEIAGKFVEKCSIRM
ncbi:MAG: anaerobic ribonucleoside-triphosphate reductase activating protein, partial [Candidatus Gracilibacteria bacterium]|nr:anaerobic ribonucleoside-triphosphate reductase activating protein [Candidatus Gracilibacteria bacterium]